MTTLIKKLEQATEGSRELDAEIWWQTNRRAAERAYWNGALGTPTALPDEMPTTGLGALAVKIGAPHYTTSVDAAMTLVSEGWIVLGFQQDHSRHWYVELCPHRDATRLECKRAEASTPALALTIAALKAQEA